jgi:hypothetical protein
LQKIKFLRLKVMCLWANKKKIRKEHNFFFILKVTEEGVRSGVGSRSGSGKLSSLFREGEGAQAAVEPGLRGVQDSVPRRVPGCCQGTVPIDA